MSKKNTYVLMYKDHEVLSFAVDFSKRTATLLKKLGRFDLAPYGLGEDNDEIGYKLSEFFNSRAMPPQRRGYKEILKATHCRNGFSLSFRGHGLSLTNHYWCRKAGERLRYEDINFFTNKWDDSFARAVLRGDYGALANVDLNVPDIVTPGWGVKGWIYDDQKGPRLYKVGIQEGNREEVLGEVLASRLAQRMFKEGEVLQYDLETIYGESASVSSPMIGVDEELIPLSLYLPFEMQRLYRDQNLNKTSYNEFLAKLKEQGHFDLYSFFVRLSCLKSLCFVGDLHFGNISMVRNMKTGVVRVAPLYDLGGSFGSGNVAKEQLRHPTKATLLLIYYMYGNLDPEWDYSWYEKDRLIGFEDEIVNVLSKTSFYTPDIIDFVLQIYRWQKESLDDIASKTKKQGQ